MAIRNNGKKYDIPSLIDPVTKATCWISPTNMVIYVGTVVTDEKGNKKVGSAVPKELGVFLSEKDDEISKLKKEISDLKINYRKNMKKLVKVLNILVGQTEVNALDLNEILDMEDK